LTGREGDGDIATMNTRTEAEQRLVEAARQVLEESKSKAVVIMTGAKGEEVVAAGDSDALLPMIETVSEPLKMLAEMSPDEQHVFFSNAPADRGDESRTDDGQHPATPFGTDASSDQD
jgi:hypothetical protein